MNAIDIGLIVMYLMVGIALVVAIILPVISLFSNPKSLIRIGIGAVALMLVFFLVYSMSDSTLTTRMTAAGETASSIKLIGAGLWMLYIFLFGSLLVMIYSEVSKLFK